MHPLEEAMLSCDMDGERSDPGCCVIPLGPCLSLVTCLAPFLGPPGIKPLDPGLHCISIVPRCLSLGLVCGILQFWAPAVPVLWPLLVAVLSFPPELS